jgi:hypothetical protein
MTRTVALAVVRRVADVTGHTPDELPPLDDTINTEAVNAIGRCDAALLQFVYWDHTVTVEVRGPGDWRVTAQPVD